MTFKELRQNNPIYMLDKSNGVTYTQGKVLNVSQPRFDTQPNTQPGTMPQMQMPQMVVDVTIEANGKTETYKFAEGTSVAASGNTLFSTDLSGILREVDATMADCEQHFAATELKQKMYEQCKKLKGELDLPYKEKQETENRFNKMEEKYDDLNRKVDKVLELLSKEK